MTEKSKTRRTPLTEPMLINYKGSWQVCYQARGTINYERVTAWVYGPDSIFFCRVGEQSEIIILPEKDKFFAGPFPFMVDRVDSNDVPIERLGGAHNAGAAIEIYNYLRPHYSSGLRLRNGIRVMKQQGKDEEA
ncbi:hypothetical protein [Shinella zoogloeoides]|uniref:hypothetical protein n=1 Tax=Shinella zoogloeoides TaxID=352475 RepID=UPI000E653A4B|nr:hypothetical protein [Shinella zoogloeoides]